MRTDWMPGKSLGRLSMARLWRDVLLQKGVELGVSAQEMAELNALILQVEEATEIARADESRVKHAKLREAYDALTSFMRLLKKRRLTSPPLTAPDFIALGLKPRDTIPTSHFEVHETVALTLEVRFIRDIIVNFRIAGTAHKAKPAACIGAVIIWTVLDEPPGNVSIAALTSHALATRTPHTLHFADDERGRRVYVAAAWQNGRGILGTWSAIMNTVVP